MDSPFHAPNSAVYRFGAFQAGFRTRELRKHGRRIRLPRLPFEVLIALIERPGDLVTREELQRRLWPDGTFVDFENNLNAAVTRLRQALGDSAEHPRFIETLPRLGYRFLPEVQAVVSQVASVRADTVPPADGVQHHAEADHERRLAPTLATPMSAGRRPWRYLATAAAIVAVAIVALIGSRFSRSEAGASAGKVMLVVLPFENLSGDEQQDYLSDGITEEMITELARVGPTALGVIARTTAFKYKGSTKSVAEIARELKVDFVVEGSVRREGDRLRVVAQLIEARGETHVWAESYDRDLRDLLALERDVAQTVGRHVRVRVMPTNPTQVRGTVAPAAREAYLRARHHAAQGTVFAIRRAIESYTAAIEIAPDYALAHAGLARALIFATQPAPEVALRQASQAAARARELDPDLPEGQLAWAMVTLYHDRDFAAAEGAFQRAVALEPGNAESHFYYAQYLTAAGRFDEALESARRAQALDPFSTLIHHYVGRILHFARRGREAVDHLERTLELDPNYAWAHLFLAAAHEQLGDFDVALGARERYWAVMGVAPDAVSRLRAAHARSGYAGVRRQWIEWIEGFARQSGFVTSTELAMLYGALGDKDTAFAWLQKAVDDQTRDLIYLRVYPELDPLRSDPRFQEILARVFPRES